MSDHVDVRLETGEPDEGSDEVYLWTIEGNLLFGSVSSEEFGADTRDANARRVVAAWNACRGISTKSLEAGAVDGLIAACQAALLFHSGTPWTVEKAAAWVSLTGKPEATTAALCRTIRDAVRKAVGDPIPIPENN